ncbi:MAG: hypothetical protein M3R17_09075 [Bacteroidota bacterium]|nr:hypothetical protein [Bacteroidota bacterium]
MKRMKCYLFLLLFLPVIVSAQMEITWGIPQKKPRKTAMTDMLGEDGTFVYTLRSEYALFGSNDPIIERYKLSDLSLDYTKVISMEGPQKRRLSRNAIYFLGGNIIIFANDYDKERDVNVLYAKILDDHSTTKKEWTIVAKISADKKSNQGSFYTEMSLDSQHILVVANPPYDQYANEKFLLQLFDRDLNSLWEKSIIPPYKDEFFALDNFIVAANDDIYMMATVSKDKTVMSKKERRSSPTYYHTVLMYEHASDNLKEYKVSLDPKFISDVRMTINEKGDIICAGFYSNKSSASIIGAFYVKIDKETKEITKQGTMDFRADFLSQFMSEKKVEKGKELYDYILRHLILRDDGGAILVAEQYYEVMVQSYDPTTHAYTYTYYYYYNDIIVVSINPAGEISWAKKIPKYQVSRNDGGYYSSFTFAVSGDKMYFMFNDNPRNLKNADENNTKYRYMNNPKKSIAVLVSMDSNGNQQRQSMFSNSDLKIILRPKLFMQMNEHRMILYGEKGSTYKLADVKFSRQ